MLRRSLAIAALAGTLGACGGTKSSTFAQIPPDADVCQGTARGDPPAVPPEHRATAAACPRTPGSNLPDGGAVPASCNTDADCAAGSGATWIHCVEHACGYDQCLVDSDCATNQLCVCNASAGGGTRTAGNVCVEAQCHVDSDCGPGAYCRPSRAGCGDVTGYYCGSSCDTCVDPTIDCSSPSECVYAPMTGHFVCSNGICSG